MFNSVETRYWSTKLKLIDIVWILRKIHHIIETSQFFIVIYIDYDAALNIAKQTSLLIIFIDKFNFRLIKASNYLQRFNLDIRHKSKKQHIIFNVLSRLTSANINELTYNALQFFANDEFDALFTAFLIEMNNEF